jgi:hypothetical protein
MALSCLSCGAENLRDDFALCPYCGVDLSTPISCLSCRRIVKPTTRFCPNCGAPLGGATVTHPGRGQQGLAQTVEVEPPASDGLTIEFLYSTSPSFGLAVQAARQFETFKQHRTGRRAIYRVTFAPEEMDSAIELVGHVEGWHRRAVYVDGQRVSWKSVFGFVRCYHKRQSSFRPELYCFGYEDTFQLNIWGCIQADLPFARRSKWFTWGRWLSEDGNWAFDKERIQEELHKNLYPCRFCPALELGRAGEVVEALPDTVNPKIDENWKFVQSWGDDSPGLMVTITQYGFREQVKMIGVAPKGVGALREIVEKVEGLELPPQLRP